MRRSALSVLLAFIVGIAIAVPILPSGCSSDATPAPTSITATGARLVRDSEGTVIGVSMLNASTSDEDLSLLADYDQIEWLKIQECLYLDGSGLEVVEDLPRLTKIELVLTPVTDEGLLHLQAASALTDVLLLDIDADDEGLAFLSGCSNIERLRLESLSITDAGLVHLAGLPKLESLSLEGCSAVTGAGFSNLETLSNLTEVNLRGTGVLPQHAENLRMLPGVHEVRLDSEYVTDDVLGVLVDLQTLQRLRLYRAPVTDHGVAYLRELQNLQLLELSACSEITNEGIEFLAGHPSLTELNLSECRRLDDGCILALATISTLKIVQLQDTGCTVEGARELKRHLPECTVVYGSSPNTEQL